MKKSTRDSIIILVVLLGAAYLLRDHIMQFIHPTVQVETLREVAKVEPTPTPLPTPTPSATPTPNAGLDVPKNAADKNLPTVDESDSSIQGEFIRLFGKNIFEAVFNPQDIILHIVTTVYNATGKQLPAQYLPVKSPENKFSVKTKNHTPFINIKNYRRYTPYVNLAEAVDMKALVTVYTRFYPLFQSAYKDLGTTDDFNHRLVTVIDNLLATPKIKGPIKLTQKSVIYYQYANPKLEKLSAAQKILIRMGPDNANRIEKKLKELRDLLTHFTK
ncbi:MAG: hypothetical protein JWQ35_1402 [Bacteriovoracaceae bacterium]|nr:hypothetical protein [Bacteriovoracaceae bacterium]